MPIKPENKNRYPKDWKQIRQRILERANNRCEVCGIQNYSMVERVVSDRHGGMVSKMVRIVLTIAHLDNTPENCDPSNLKAMCQKCHINYDKEFHARNARITRERKRIEQLKEQGQLTLF